MLQCTKKHKRLFFGCLSGIIVVVAVFILVKPYVMERVRQHIGKQAIVKMWFGGGGLQVRSMSFSPDGKHLAVGYRFPPLTCIWNVQPGKQVMVIEENKHESIERVTYSPDGKLLAIGIEKLSDVGSTGLCTRVRDAETGKLIKEIDGISSYWPIFTPDGNMLVGEKIYKMPEGTLVKRLTDSGSQEFWTLGLWSTKDGNLLGASGSDDSNTIALIWDAKTGQLLKSLKRTEPKICSEANSFDFHPDSKHVVIGTTDDAFYVWNIETDVMEIIRREGGRWWAVKYSPDGRLVAATGAGGIVLLWDMLKNKELCALKRHTGSVYALEFSPKGDLLATGGMDGVVRLWGTKENDRTQWSLVRKLKINFTAQD